MNLFVGVLLLPSFQFILVEELLSRLLKHNFENRKIVHFSHSRGAPLISHLLYANDVIVFTNGDHTSLKNIIDIFNLYKDWLGQVVSKEKSSLATCMQLRLTLALNRATTANNAYAFGVSLA